MEGFFLAGWSVLYPDGDDIQMGIQMAKKKKKAHG